ncbi:hypothetical protein ACIOTN_17000 [Glutamicibacter sp. NPDC087661]|uniref:hypothetical protein n=1 Tax=Glutamicibacter sp. NPDC087661 TaxID=3363996 RepID=UPI0038153D1B
MNDLIFTVIGSGVGLTAIGTLGSGMFFFLTGAKNNQKTAELRESEAALNRTRVESAKVANRVANEMGRKLASVEGLGEFALGFSPNEDGPCQCGKCKARRGETDV